MLHVKLESDRHKLFRPVRQLRRQFPRSITSAQPLRLQGMKEKGTNMRMPSRLAPFFLGAMLSVRGGRGYRTSNRSGRRLIPKFAAKSLSHHANLPPGPAVRNSCSILACLARYTVSYAESCTITSLSVAISEGVSIGTGSSILTDGLVSVAPSLLVSEVDSSGEGFLSSSDVASAASDDFGGTTYGI